jgi:hypothetical protein
MDSSETILDEPIPLKSLRYEIRERWFSLVEYCILTACFIGIALGIYILFKARFYHETPIDFMSFVGAVILLLFNSIHPVLFIFKWRKFSLRYDPKEPKEAAYEVSFSIKDSFIKPSWFWILASILFTILLFEEIAYCTKSQVLLFILISLVLGPLLLFYAKSVKQIFKERFKINIDVLPD